MGGVPCGEGVSSCAPEDEGGAVRASRIGAHVDGIPMRTIPALHTPRSGAASATDIVPTKRAIPENPSESVHSCLALTPTASRSNSGSAMTLLRTHVRDSRHVRQVVPV